MEANDKAKLKLEELNRPALDTYRQMEKLPVYVVLDNIRSAINIGSVFRSADAFAVKKIFLCGVSATPPNKDILKSALGATESVEWEYCTDTVALAERLKEMKVQLLSIEQARNSVALDAFVPLGNQSYAVILGNEIEGVQQVVVDKSDTCIEIPQSGTKHSLNVAVCAGIVLWHFYRHLHLKQH